MMTSRDRIAMTLTGLAEIYGERMSPARLEGYISLLQGVDLWLLQDALAQLAKELKWFPKPAEILEGTNALARKRAMCAHQQEEPDLSDEERKSVLQHNAEFKARMGWE